MKAFLFKMILYLASFSATLILIEVTEADPAMYLLALWIWKELSEAAEEQEGHTENH